MIIQKIPRFCILVAGVLALSLFSCFHKSNKTGTADNVDQSFVCHTDKGDFLITHEEVFHATSKSYNGGISQITGYVAYRYTVRDLKTGEQVTRLITGGREDDLLPLCFDGKYLWCYGGDEKTGIEALDPVTLHPAITRQQIESANPGLAGKLSIPKTVEAAQYYFYDPTGNHIIMTDQQGILYALDLSSLKTTVIAQKPSFSSFDEAISTSAYRWADKEISLRGDPRQQLDAGDNKISKESFLKAQLLLEQNKVRLSEIARELIKGKQKEMHALQLRCDSMLKAHPLLVDESKAYSNYKDYHMIDNYFDLTRKLRDMKEDSASRPQEIGDDLDNMVLGCDSNTLYIVHANNLSDTSSVMFSKVNYKSGSFTTQWTTHIPGIYFDPDKGINKNPMKDVFKAGSPEFRYEWYGLEGNVLVGVKMLFAFGIDTQTGTLLWKKQL